MYNVPSGMEKAIEDGHFDSSWIYPAKNGGFSTVMLALYGLYMSVKIQH